MDRATIEARHAEFSVKLESLLVEYKDALAPDVDAEGYACQCEMDCDCKPPSDLLATEWFLIANYQDLGGGGCTIVGTAPINMLNSHVLGLIEYYKVTRGWA